LFENLLLLLFDQLFFSSICPMVFSVKNWVSSQRLNPK